MNHRAPGAYFRELIERHRNGRSVRQMEVDGGLDRAVLQRLLTPSEARRKVVALRLHPEHLRGIAAATGVELHEVVTVWLAELDLPLPPELQLTPEQRRVLDLMRHLPPVEQSYLRDTAELRDAYVRMSSEAADPD